MTYQFKTEPYDHQRRALELAGGRSGFAFLMEMGTGKTKVAIDEAGTLFCDGCIDTMVILPPKSVVRTWINELSVHMGCAYRAAAWPAGGGGAAASRELRKILSGPEDQLRVLVMNIEALSSGTKARNFLMEFLESGRCYMAIDESTTIKTPTSKRTKKVLELGRAAEYRRIMTGSPTPRSPLDLYTQFEFIQPGCMGQRSFYGFRSRYAVLQKKFFGGRSVQVEVGYRNTEELQRKIEPLSYRVRKDECLDLPSKIYTSRQVTLTAEQRQAYSDMREEALLLLGDEMVSSTSAITTLMKLQQIVCGFVRTDEEDIVQLDSSRTDALLEITEECPDEDFIIWTGHRPAVDLVVSALREKYGEGSVAEFHGGNVRTRDDEAQRFMSDPECRFMVSTQPAGARGNTWINATQVVYFSNTYNLEDRVQSEDRAHRSGQTRHVVYTDLIAENTVDEKLIEALRRKESVAAQLVGESPRDWM